MRYIKIFRGTWTITGNSFFRTRAEGAGREVGFGAPGYYAGAPVCTYGYYDYYPYTCAPYGYYAA